MNPHPDPFFNPYRHGAPVNFAAVNEAALLAIPETRDPMLTGERCRCRACGEYFNSAKAFDRHRFGRCRTAMEMRELGMARNAGGYWVSEPMPNVRFKPPGKGRLAEIGANPISWAPRVSQ